MKFKFQHNELVPDLPYIPKKVTNIAMVTYLLALVMCLIIYHLYALQWRWMLFGIIEVVGFFYFANTCSRGWISFRPRRFIQNLFWWGFAIRVLWVIISYLLYMEWTGTAFSIGAADEKFYDEMGHYGASLMRDGNFAIYDPLTQYAGDVQFSDMGYPIYLSIIYYIFFDSILIARIIKALLGAGTAVLVYKLASRNFGEYTGRMAGIMCMLMPNLIYYCSFQLKEVEMVFLAMLFIERADALLRLPKMPWRSLLLLMLIPIFLFMIRTALAATLVMGFALALLLTSDRVVKGWRRVMLIGAVGVFGLVIVASESNIITDVQQMWQTGGSQQRANMEWRAERTDMAGGLNQKFAKYAGASVFAPLIFTIPFPTMAETPGQENQKMIHGGNYVKNIISFFTIAALFILLFSGKWRRYVLPVSILCGYLVVLVFSTFAHSERFHLPIMPLHLMMAAYGISQMNKLRILKKGYPWWCVLMIVAALAWNWFKLAGRGMI